LGGVPTELKESRKIPKELEGRRNNRGGGTERKRLSKGKRELRLKKKHAGSHRVSLTADEQKSVQGPEAYRG